MEDARKPWWERQLFKIRIGKYRWGHLRRDIYEDVNRRYQGNRLPPSTLRALAAVVQYDHINMISVVVPTRNRLEALRTYALPSLLQQNFAQEKFEIIIVDNSSNSQTWEYLEQAQLPRHVRIVRESRRGVCRAINRGLSLVQGEVVTFLEDDACADPQWLYRMYQWHRTGHYLLGQGMVYDEPLKQILNLADDPIRERNFLDGNMSYQREVFDFASFNNHLIYGHEGYDLMTQIFTFWPDFQYYVDAVPIRHYRAPSEFRQVSHHELNDAGFLMEKKMHIYWYLDQHILQRNLEVSAAGYPVRFWLKEILFAPLELFFISGNIGILLRLKWRIFLQLKKIRALSVA